MSMKHPRRNHAKAAAKRREQLQVQKAEKRDLRARLAESQKAQS